MNDQFTSKQVALIYSNLLLGMSKDDAIRDMQLHYIRADDSNGANAMPYYWAAYQCQGRSKARRGTQATKTYG